MSHLLCPIEIFNSERSKTIQKSKITSRSTRVNGNRGISLISPIWILKVLFRLSKGPCDRGRLLAPLNRGSLRSEKAHCFYIKELWLIKG
ncbi:hypothetical protein CDAR_48951 [Caerostris darwini]|uniref:Uncharacterized protein n=1 Tax=Caerostris darwini TaxID=1538125 RepID=A0AAV4NK33_9ARAC|nr:hypothetical protein CDAR_48951 [Caerostris darwini]